MAKKTMKNHGAVAFLWRLKDELEVSLQWVSGQIKFFRFVDVTLYKLFIKNDKHGFDYAVIQTLNEHLDLLNYGKKAFIAAKKFPPSEAEALNAVRQTLILFLTNFIKDVDKIEKYITESEALDTTTYAGDSEDSEDSEDSDDLEVEEE